MSYAQRVEGGNFFDSAQATLPETRSLHARAEGIIDSAKSINLGVHRAYKQLLQYQTAVARAFSRDIVAEDVDLLISALQFVVENRHQAISYKQDIERMRRRFLPFDDTHPNIRALRPGTRRAFRKAHASVEGSFATLIRHLEGSERFFEDWEQRILEKISDLNLDSPTAKSPPDPWPPEDRND